MPNRIKTAALAATTALGLLLAPASQAQTQIRANAQPAQQQQQQGNLRTEHCAKVEVHLNEMGMAFACYQADVQPVFMIAVLEQGFKNRMDYVWEMLNSATEVQSGVARGSGKGIHVTMSHGTDALTRSLCVRTRGIVGVIPCYKAINITKR